jgi:hypothetical protein
MIRRCWLWAGALSPENRRMPPQIRLPLFPERLEVIELQAKKK